MSYKAQNWAHDLTVAPSGQAVTATEKALLYALAWHHNGPTGRCDPSVPTLAKGMGATERTVQRTLHDLSPAETCTEPDACRHPHKGVVAAQHRTRGAGRSTSSSYILAGLDVPEPRQAVTPTPDGASPLPLTERHPTPDGASPPVEQEVNGEDQQEEKEKSLSLSFFSGAPLDGWGGQPDESAHADAWQDFDQTTHVSLKGDTGITWGTSRAYTSEGRRRGDPPPLTRDDLLGKVVPFVQTIRRVTGDSGRVRLPDLGYTKAYSDQGEHIEPEDGGGLARLAAAADNLRQLLTEHPEAADPVWLGGHKNRSKRAGRIVARYAAAPGRMLGDFTAWATDVARDAAIRARVPAAGIRVRRRSSKPTGNGKPSAEPLAGADEHHRTCEDDNCARCHPAPEPVTP